MLSGFASLGQAHTSAIPCQESAGESVDKGSTGFIRDFAVPALQELAKSDDACDRLLDSIGATWTCGQLQTSKSSSGCFTGAPPVSSNEHADAAGAGPLPAPGAASSASAPAAGAAAALEASAVSACTCVDSADAAEDSFPGTTCASASVATAAHALVLTDETYTGLSFRMLLVGLMNLFHLCLLCLDQNVQYHFVLIFSYCIIFRHHALFLFIICVMLVAYHTNGLTSFKIRCVNLSSCQQI